MAAAVVGKHHGKVKRIYTAALKGMAIEIPDSAAAGLRQDPAVALVEQNQEVYAVGGPIVQPGPPVGLDRIDQRFLPLSGTYSYSADGAGVRVYIIDTGINFAHDEFGGRAELGIDAIGTGGIDCNGHGTHVAGTVGGATYGVAKKVRLVAVRVLDCNGIGNIFSLLDGIEWVTANRVLPAVANMSVGTGLSTLLDAAVENSISTGVTYAVAAGNSGDDACAFSPSNTPNALTVAASDQSDVLASFSNRGICVDLEAPGVGIASAWIGSSSATMALSGTSMASPHVAGAAALYLSGLPGARPDEVGLALIGNATRNVLTSVPMGTPNRLLYTNFFPIFNRWTARASLLAGRSAFALGLANGRLYAIGGRSLGVNLASVEMYDVTANTWTGRAPMPSVRYDGDGAWYINGFLYVPGGRNSSGVLTSTLYAYNPATNTWNTKAALPTPSGCGGTLGTGGQLYVFTGCSAPTGFRGALHRYNPSTNTWTARAAPPVAHGHAAFGVINGRLYVAGGRNAAGTPIATLHVYDAATNAWSARRVMPAARVGAAGQAINGKLYVVGGTVAGVARPPTLVYDPATDAWSSKSEVPTTRTRLGAQAIGGFLYAVGGRDGATDMAVVERYTP
jgi:aqualysin 1